MLNAEYRRQSSRRYRTPPGSELGFALRTHLSWSTPATRRGPLSGRAHEVAAEAQARSCPARGLIPRRLDRFGEYLCHPRVACGRRVQAVGADQRKIELRVDVDDHRALFQRHLLQRVVEGEDERGVVAARGYAWLRGRSGSL